MTCGATGVISVASNVIPQRMAQLVGHARGADYARAISENLELFPLFKNLFIEPNPVPVKYAMKRLGAIQSDEVRGPLCSLKETSRQAIDETLKRFA